MDLELDKKTAERMGHPNAVAAASTALGQGLLEVALVPPGVFRSWAVVTHIDCDPENPTAGTSGVEEFATQDLAEEGFRTALRDIPNSSWTP